MERLGGHRIGYVAASAVFFFALALSLAACGGDSEGSNASEPSASYPVVYTADFPVRQRLGETSLLRIGVRNAGREQMSALTVSISIAGKDGQQSALAFGIRDPQPELAQPDRPVWVLSEHYPKLAGSTSPGGAETTNEKTFEFGALKPGEKTEAVWKLSAVRTGGYRLLYEIGAGLGGKAKAETEGGDPAVGSLAVRIVEVPPNTVVTDSGEVVPAPRDPTEANR